MQQLLGLLSLLAATSSAFAQDDWQSVRAKDGGFSVEMPKKPDIERTRTRKGGSKSVFIVCKTDGGIYSVQRIDLTTAIVKGAEEKELDSIRDDIAEDFNGKILTEKKVKAGLRIGRDFTIRGKPADEVGPITIRVRMYLEGKSIYAMVVASAPNRELPEDGGRFLGSLAIGKEAAKVSAGIEPEPTGKKLADWGIAVDPDNDCKFTLDGKKAVTLELPGNAWHDLNPHVNKLNSPRLLHAVQGDFSLTVKVTGEFKPNGKSLNPKSVPSMGAGIIVWNNSDNFIRLERFAISRNKKVGTFVLFLEREAGYQGAEHNKGYAGGDCYLRMERKGSRIIGSISFDGTKYESLKPIDTLWPSHLNVGLTVSNSNSDPMTVKFAEFSLQGKIVPRDN